MNIKTLLNGINVDPEDVKIADSLSAEDIAKLVSFAKDTYDKYLVELAKSCKLEQELQDVKNNRQVKNGFKPAEKKGISSSVLYELRAKGKSVNEIAKMYNISRATVWRKLKDEENKRKNWKSEDNIFVENSDVEEECMMYKMEHLIVEETIIKDNKEYSIDDIIKS